jgi:hypothetical protein
MTTDADCPRPFDPPPPADPIEYQGWLDSIVRLSIGARLRGVHPETLRREARKGRVKLVQMTENTLGIRRREALMIELPGRGGRRRAGGARGR